MELIGADVVRCPKCGNDYLEPANGDAQSVPEWHGEKPTTLQ